MFRICAALLVMCFLAACSLKPTPIPNKERYEEATKDLAELFARQEPLHGGRLTFYEALARGLKYNLDYRIKQVNTALQAGQLDLAIFTMFPALNVSGSIYNRNNKYASSGITSTGQPTDVLTSTPNTIRSARAGISWNMLDFGMGYVKAKQQGNKVLITEEEERRQMQELAQEILIAYWSAYSAQELTKETKEFQKILMQAKHQMSLAMQDKAIPKESLLNYQATMLEGDRRLIQLQYKYNKAMLDLKRLLNLTPDANFILERPPISLTKMQDLSDLDFRKLDAITLVLRPELRGQHYQERIAKDGIKLVILQALPSAVLNDAWNYNSNKYLLNKIWIDRSIDLAWNLLNVASLPTAYKAAKMQVCYEKLKQQALALGALIETRYAYSNYETLRQEYMVAHQQTQNAAALYKLNKDRQLASLANEQQVVISKLRVLTTKMDEDLLLANLSSSLGQLYSSAGFDILPPRILHKPLHEMTWCISKNFITQKTWNFKTYVNSSFEKIFPEKCGRRTAKPCKVIKPHPASYCIQLCSSHNLKAIKKMQQRLKLTKETRFASNGDNYLLIMGQFASRRDAYKKIKILPKTLRQLSPWAREITGIKLIQCRKH